MDDHGLYELFRNGMRLLDQGDYHAAAVPLRRARELARDKDSVREAYGRALFGSQRFREAAEEFGAVVEHSPTDHYSLFCLGRSLHPLGRPQRPRPPAPGGGPPPGGAPPAGARLPAPAAPRGLPQVPRAVPPPRRLSRDRLA